MSYVTHPFEYLKKLELNATRYSTGLPQEENSLSYWDGVGFKLNDYLFTAGIADIAEVIRVPEMTPLPGVKQWTKGLANVHGRLIPIIDLREFFDLPKLPASSNHRVIVIDQEEITVGLVVEEVHGLQHLSESEYDDALPANLPDNILPFTGGCYQQENRHIVFDINRLISSDCFLAAASE